MAAATVSRLGVVGAGFMGSGIAESAASSGIDVTVFEPESAPLERSRERLKTSVNALARVVAQEGRPSHIQTGLRDAQ